MAMIGEVDAATIAASTADSSGAPSATSAAPTASAAHRPSSTQLAASQGLSISQRGRSRLPSSNTSAAMARSMIGFQPSRSSGLQQAQAQRTGQRADQHVAGQPRQLQQPVQRAGRDHGDQHHRGQTQHRVELMQVGPVERTAPGAECRLCRSSSLRRCPPVAAVGQSRTALRRWHGARSDGGAARKFLLRCGSELMPDP